jgi:hypothetical protein
MARIGEAYGSVPAACRPIFPRAPKVKYPALPEGIACTKVGQTTDSVERGGVQEQVRCAQRRLYTAYPTPVLYTVHPTCLNPHGGMTHILRNTLVLSYPADHHKFKTQYEIGTGQMLYLIKVPERHTALYTILHAAYVYPCLIAFHIDNGSKRLIEVRQ